MEKSCTIPSYFKPLQQFDNYDKVHQINRNRKPWYYVTVRMNAPKDALRYFKAQGQYLNQIFSILMTTTYNLRGKKIGYIQSMCNRDIKQYNKRHPVFKYRSITLETSKVPSQFVGNIVWRITTHFWKVRRELEEHFGYKKTVSVKEMQKYIKQNDTYKYLHYDTKVPRFTYYCNQSSARLNKLLGIHCRSVYKRRFRLSYDFASAVVIPDDYALLDEMATLDLSQYKVHRFEVVIPDNSKVVQDKKEPLKYNMKLLIYISQRDPETDSKPEEVTEETVQDIPEVKKEEVRPSMLDFSDMPEVTINFPIKPNVKIPKTAKRDWDGFYHLHYKNPFIIQRFDVKEPLNISDVFPLCKLENRRYVYNPGDILGQYDDDFYQIRMLYWFWRERYDRVIEVMRDIVKDYDSMDFFIAQLKQAMHNMYDFWIKIEDNLPEEIREERVRGLQEQQRRRYEMAELNLDRDRMRDEEDYSLAAR